MLKKIADFIKRNTVRITAFVTAVIGLLLAFDAVQWSQAQVGAILTVLGAFLAFFISGTVTANERLTGKMWEGYTGVNEE